MCSTNSGYTHNPLVCLLQRSSTPSPKHLRKEAPCQGEPSSLTWLQERRGTPSLNSFSPACLETVTASWGSESEELSPPAKKHQRTAFVRTPLGTGLAKVGRQWDKPHLPLPGFQPEHPLWLGVWFQADPRKQPPAFQSAALSLLSQLFLQKADPGSKGICLSEKKNVAERQEAPEAAQAASAATELM